KMSVAEGHGPVNALDIALRKDLDKYQSEIVDLSLADFKVRILNGGTEAITRVLVESHHSTGARWWTVVASEHSTDASFQRRGFLLALGAYFLWGLLPFYMKAVAHLPLAEVIANRVVWSVPIAAAVLVWAGRTADFKVAIRTPKSIAMAALTAVLISINWGIYVWAIAVGRTVETALGYYINPLVSVVVGALLLGERLARLH